MTLYNIIFTAILVFLIVVFLLSLRKINKQEEPQTGSERKQAEKMKTRYPVAIICFIVAILLIIVPDIFGGIKAKDIIGHVEGQGTQPANPYSETDLEGMSDEMPKLADAPKYHFGAGQFMEFRGDPIISNLSDSRYYQYYSNDPSYIDIQTDNMKEATEWLAGGEFFEMLFSPIINAYHTYVRRGAAIINGKQQDWVLLNIRLFYERGEVDTNRASLNSDIVTIFANCNEYFVEAGFRKVIVFSGGTVSIYEIENDTFLSHFE